MKRAKSSTTSKDIVRSRILGEKRIDGRDPDMVRTISVATGVLHVPTVQLCLRMEKLGR